MCERLRKKFEKRVGEREREMGGEQRERECGLSVKDMPFGEVYENEGSMCKLERQRVIHKHSVSV